MVKCLCSNGQRVGQHNLSHTKKTIQISHDHVVCSLAGIMLETADFKVIWIPVTHEHILSNTVTVKVVLGFIIFDLVELICWTGDSINNRLLFVTTRLHSIINGLIILN